MYVGTLLKLSETEARAQLQSDILGIFHNNEWKDYEDFSVKLTTQILSDKATSLDDLRKAMESIKTIFFQANNISKNKVCQVLFVALSEHLSSYVYSNDLITVNEIFPEIEKTSDIKAECRLKDFQKDEQSLQKAFRQIFRNKKASLPKRDRDSALEVADIEHFVLDVSGRKLTFAVVVKGFKSTGKSKLRWEDIAYQVTRANQANPDHILAISAKEPVDGLLTNIANYNKDISRVGCVLFVPPLDMARILVSNGF